MERVIGILVDVASQFFVEMNFMVTGLPGCGKTTLVQRVVEQLGRSYDLATVAAGFTTEEVRGPRGRIGFDVVALNGRKGPLSRSEETSTSWPSDQKVRNVTYGVTSGWTWESRRDRASVGTSSMYPRSKAWRCRSWF